MKILQYLSIPFLIGTIWGVFQYFRNRKYKIADEKRNLLSGTLTELNEASNKVHFDIVKIISEVNKSVMSIDKLISKNQGILKKLDAEIKNIGGKLKEIESSEGQSKKVNSELGKQLEQVSENIESKKRELNLEIQNTKKETINLVIETTFELRQKIENLNAIPLFSFPVEYNPKINITKLTLEVEELINGLSSSTYFNDDFTLDEIVFEKLRICLVLISEIEQKIYLSFE